MNIVCLKWGKLYDAEYVNNLYCGFKRNSTVSFDFYCVTEDKNGIMDKINIIDLPKLGIPTWWNKLWLFSPDFPVKSGRIFYSDLDNVVVGNVDDLLKFDGKFLTINVFHPTKIFNRVGSGIMSWDANKHNHIWDRFFPNRTQIINDKKKYRGMEQYWITEVQPERVYLQDVLPGHVRSYIFDCKNSLPKNARILCYEGPIKIRESIEHGLRYRKDTLNYKPIWNRPAQNFIKENWKSDEI